MKRIKLWNATPANDNAGLQRPVVTSTVVRDETGDWTVVVLPLNQQDNDARSPRHAHGPVLS